MVDVTETAAAQLSMAPGASGRGFFSRTLSGRLVIVFAVLLLVPTVLSVYLAWDSFVEHKARAELQVRQFASLTAAYENQFFEDVRERLQQLANDPEIRDSRGHCAPLLQPTLEQTPEFAHIGFYNSGGTPICSTEEDPSPVGNRSWLREALGFGGFAISDYTIIPDSPFPAIVAAQAVYDAEGRVFGVLAASIRLYWLSAFMRDISLPDESVFFLVDGNGNVLADRTVAVGQDDFEAWRDFSTRPTGLSAYLGSENSIALTSRRLTEFEVVGDDGIRRVFSSIALPHGGVTVLFGMPVGSGIGWLEKDLISQILAVLATWLAGIGAAWIGARHLVTRWIKALHEMAQAYAGGDFSVSHDLTHAPNELHDLGRTLTLMAKRVDEREAQLKASLDQKNVLLKEIHHRVKNNLQIVSSLLNIRGDEDGGSGQGIEKVKSQVRALALVHRHLYESEDVQEIDLGPFMKELCRTTMAGLSPESRRVSLTLQIPRFYIPADRAIPIALLTVEALTNSLKHAFPDNREGEIRVDFLPGKAGNGTLSISDNGVGLPEDFSSESGTHSGLGLMLIEAFARQVNGTLSIEGPPGATIQVVLQGARDLGVPAEPSAPAKAA